ncbi:baseplate J/gp47 family protein [Muricoccus aerilatus]|uniref:baseplate J/gp47 family protein n=1 Tax=Muricoccus aerilatus TaxID=452982 RepID=UPI0005C1D4F6|nr:baseplate J/gp47 family protein [Roseomonas aerilata]
MPFARPGLSELIRQALADLAQALNVPAVLRWRPEWAMGRALAGVAQGLYGYLDWIARQAVPATSTGEFRAAWAALRGVFPREASFAAGPAAFVGTPGAILPAGTPVRRADGSAAYVTSADATAALDGTTSVQLTASTSGPAANAPAGIALVLGAAVPGITSAGAAAGPLRGGADAEDVDSDGFLTRMLLAYAEPAQGGAPRDYLDWVYEVPGVTRAWVQPNGMGAGTVIVRFMMDEANAEDGGFPQGTNGVAAAEARAAAATGDQLAVADHLYPLRPTTALVYAVAPTPYPVNVTVANLLGLTPAIRAAAADKIRAMLLERAVPGGTIYPNEFSTAIDSVPGVTVFTLLEPTLPVLPPVGGLVTLGSLNFQS